VRFRAAIGDVGCNAVVEKDGLLVNQSNAASKTGKTDVGNILAIDQNGAAVDFIEAHQQVGQCTFAAAGTTDQRYGLPGLYCQVKVLQPGRFCIVTEADITEFDTTLGNPELLFAMVRLGRCVNDFKNGFGSGEAFLDDFIHGAE